MNAFSKLFIRLSLCVYKTFAIWVRLLLFLSFIWPESAFVCLTPPLILITSEGGVKSGTDDSCRIPSPVPPSDVISEEQTPWSLSKQEESTKEECEHRNLPDIERDDMLVRRLGTFPRRTTSSIPVNCPPLSVAPYLLQQQQQEEAVAREKDLKILQKGERSENRSRSLWAWFVCGVSLDQSAMLSRSLHGL